MKISPKLHHVMSNSSPLSSFYFSLWKFCQIFWIFLQNKKDKMFFFAPTTKKKRIIWFVGGLRKIFICKVPFFLFIDLMSWSKYLSIIWYYETILILLSYHHWFGIFIIIRPKYSRISGMDIIETRKNILEKILEISIQTNVEYICAQFNE